MAFYPVVYFCLNVFAAVLAVEKEKMEHPVKTARESGSARLFFFLSVLIGVPILMIAIILGVLWAYISGEAFYWYDVKTIGSFIVLGVYIGYLVFRVVKGFKGKQNAILNVNAFLFLLVNYFLFSTLSNFHF